MSSEKLKKYSVTVSKTISVLASDEDAAKEKAIDDFDCTDLDCEIEEDNGNAVSNKDQINVFGKKVEFSNDGLSDEEYRVWREMLIGKGRQKKG